MRFVRGIRPAIDHHVVAEALQDFLRQRVQQELHVTAVSGMSGCPALLDLRATRYPGCAQQPRTDQ
jgi:hypothetical protein